MKITQIRNETLKVEYGGVCFLIDPWLQDVGSITSFVEPGTLKNPTVPLPMPVDEVLSGVDCYVITHVHPDHLGRRGHRQQPAHYGRTRRAQGARGGAGRHHHRIAPGCRRPCFGDAHFTARLC